MDTKISKYCHHIKKIIDNINNNPVYVSISDRDYFYLYCEECFTSVKVIIDGQKLKDDSCYYGFKIGKIENISFIDDLCEFRLNKAFERNDTKEIKRIIQLMIEYDITIEPEILQKVIKHKILQFTPKSKSK